MKKRHVQFTAAASQYRSMLLNSSLKYFGSANGIDVHRDRFLRVFVLQVKRVGRYKFGGRVGTNDMPK